jgi:hypothetical protein
MKVGDLVKPHNPGQEDGLIFGSTLPVEDDWRGIIIGWDEGDPVVFWNKDFPNEREYANQLEVISESR